MNDYQEKCLALAKIYHEAGETGQAIQRCNCVADGFKDVIDAPTQLSNLALYRVKPEERPMEKYIKLNLDMEFTSHTDFNTDDKIAIGKLTGFEKLESGLTFIMDELHSNYKCRLRPNHIHFWNRFAPNPIPTNCQFRTFNRVNEWSDWRDSSDKEKYVFDGLAEKPILAFEVKYK